METNATDRRAYVSCGAREGVPSVSNPKTELKFTIIVRRTRLSGKTRGEFANCVTVLYLKEKTKKNRLNSIPKVSIIEAAD